MLRDIKVNQRCGEAQDHLVLYKQVKGFQNLCSDFSTGVMCSTFLVLVGTAAFWTSYSCLTYFLLKPVKTPIQYWSLLKNAQPSFVCVWFRRKPFNSCYVSKLEVGQFYNYLYVSSFSSFGFPQLPEESTMN